MAEAKTAGKKTVTFIGNGVVMDPDTLKVLCRFAVEPLMDPEGNKVPKVRDEFGRTRKGSFTTADQRVINKMRELGYKEKK